MSKLQACARAGADTSVSLYRDWVGSLGVWILLIGQRFRTSQTWVQQKCKLTWSRRS